MALQLVEVMEASNVPKNALVYQSMLRFVFYPNSFLLREIFSCVQDRVASLKVF